MRDTQNLVEKIQALPPERVGEVEDFVDFLVAREKSRALTLEAATASAASFQAIWDGAEDDVYDAI